MRRVVSADGDATPSPGPIRRSFRRIRSVNGVGVNRALGPGSAFGPSVKRPTLIIAFGAVAVVAAACAGTSDGTASEPASAAEVETPALTREVYRSLVDSVGRATLEATRLMNQIALFATTDDSTRINAERDVRLVIEALQSGLETLIGAEPVPPATREAHADLKTALERYVEAASLLLPADDGGPETFEPERFRDLMLEGGKHFHGAGASLSEAR